MYQDYKDLLSAFHAHGVRYLIVSGYAVIFHAQPRFTKDMNSSSNRIQPMRGPLMPRLTHSPRHSTTSSPRTSRIATVFSVLDAIRMASIFFPAFRVSILKRHGNLRR